MPRSMIATRVRAGDWVRIDTAVFGHIAAPPTWERSVMAAVLAERVAVASHRTAAVLHGLEGFRRGRPELTVPPGAPGRGRLPRSEERAGGTGYVSTWCNRWSPCTSK